MVQTAWPNNLWSSTREKLGVKLFLEQSELQELLFPHISLPLSRPLPFYLYVMGHYCHNEDCATMIYFGHVIVSVHLSEQ